MVQRFTSAPTVAKHLLPLAAARRRQDRLRACRFPVFSPVVPNSNNNNNTANNNTNLLKKKAAAPFRNRP